MNKIRILVIAALLSVIAITPIVAQNTTPTSDNPQTALGTGVIVAIETGKDMLQTRTLETRQAYIMGVIEGAFTLDQAYTFTCQDVSRFTKTEIAEQIATAITNDAGLQNQPVVFSILNAYNRLYCPAKTATAPAK